jgi:gamma-carbonic anhydrase
VRSLDTGFPADVSIGKWTYLHIIKFMFSIFCCLNIIGDYVSIGAGANLTSCVVGHRTVIGEGAIVEAGVEIGKNCVIAPGSVVVRNTLVPSGQFWAGNPAAYVRDVTEEELNAQKESVEAIENASKEHAEEFLPYGTVYQHAEELNLVK